MLFLGADHAGFEAKDIIKEYLSQIKVPFEDLGAESVIPGDDYPDYAEKVGVRVAKGFGDGILICDTGIGMAIAANKIDGVRATLCTNIFMAQRSKAHNDSNILCLAAAVNSLQELVDIVRVWMDTPFSGEQRHIQRNKKIALIEKVLRV